MMGERVTQKEAAKRFGVSAQAVNQLIKRGILPLIDGKVDLDVAEAIVLKRLMPSRSKILQNATDRALGGARQQPTRDVPPSLLVPPAMFEPSGALDENLSYAAARTIEKRYLALEAKARYEERMGTLVPVGEIEPAMIAAMVSAREYLLEASRRLAAAVQGLDPAQAEAVIAQTHTEFLRRLSRWRPGELIDPDAEELPEPGSDAVDDADGT